jgi:hypothetical protein
MPIQLTHRFILQYGQLPVMIQQKIDKAIRLLDADFRHPGLHSHPVKSAPGGFSLRRRQVPLEFRASW